MIQKGPFYLGEANEMSPQELVDSLSKELALTRMMPSFERLRPSFEKEDVENIVE